MFITGVIVLGILKKQAGLAGMKKKKKKFSQMQIKIHDGERYLFKGGVAKVPGTLYRGKPMLITLREFTELAGENNGR
jgi:hypothetical protein